MKTIRVRIPIAVTNEGFWFATNRDENGAPQDLYSEYSVRKYMSEHFGPDFVQLSWIEADVPVPDEATVEGRVVDENLRRGADE